jgi:hypothetical protein
MKTTVYRSVNTDKYQVTISIENFDNYNGTQEVFLISRISTYKRNPEVIYSHTSSYIVDGNNLLNFYKDKLLHAIDKLKFEITEMKLDVDINLLKFLNF